MVQIDITTLVVDAGRVSESSSLPGGPLEESVLASLWELGRASTREVHERVAAVSDLAYTTTATVLDRLHTKGLVNRKREGKSFIYWPRVSREATERKLARRIVLHLLGASPRPAIAALVDAFESIDPELLDELARAVRARKRSRGGS